MRLSTKNKTSAEDVLRLRFRPTRILADGVALPADHLAVQPAGGGDYIVRIRHDDSRRISLSG